MSDFDFAYGAIENIEDMIAEQLKHLLHPRETNIYQARPYLQAVKVFLSVVACNEDFNSEYSPLVPIAKELLDKLKAPVSPHSWEARQGFLATPNKRKAIKVIERWLAGKPTCGERRNCLYRYSEKLERLT